MDIQKLKTRHSAETLTKLITSNPIRKLPSGDIVLPPARLSFADLAKPSVPKPPKTEGKFGANLLWPLPNVDLGLLRDARLAKLAEAFPQNPTGAGMKNPFKNQSKMIAPAEGGENVKGKTYGGYVAGCPFISATGNRRPGCFKLPIVNGVPTAVVTEEEIKAEFYAGAWVVAVVNCYVSKVGENPGVFFGLQSVMKVLDDNSFGDGAGPVDPTAFAAVNISADVDPTSLF